MPPERGLATVGLKIGRRGDIAPMRNLARIATQAVPPEGPLQVATH